MLVRTRSRWLPVQALLLLALALTAALLATPATATPLGLGEARGAEWTLGSQPCRLIGVPAASPAGLLPSATPVGRGGCEGVRPGAIVKTDDGQCSFNFLFIGTDKKTKKQTRYMGTAGHCVLLQGAADELTTPPPTEKLYRLGRGPAAMDSNGRRIGEFAYAVLADPKDFALIRLDDGVQASPQMCSWGGPTGINTDRPPTSQTVKLRQYGQGLLISTVAPARTLTARGMPDRDHVFATGIVLPGDSGSGVTSADGRAVGVTVTVGLNMAGLGDSGTVGITRLQPQLDRAGRELGQDLKLVTAPRLR
ncbi:MAG: hypothetical protein ACRDZ4_02545 [Egibacteraceae bacterium]